MMRFAGNTISQQATEQQRTLQYAVSDATSRARAESARVELKLEMAQEKVEKYKKKCDLLQKEVNKLKEELTITKQQNRTNSSSHANQLPFRREENTSRAVVSSNDDAHKRADTTTTTTTTTHEQTQPLPAQEDEFPHPDILTRDNLPALSYCVQENAQYSPKIASLIHYSDKFVVLSRSAPVYVNVPLKGVYCFGDLLPLLCHQVTTNKLELQISRVGIFLESNCLTISSSGNVRYAPDFSNERANHFNIANITQAICSQEIVNYIFTESAKDQTNNKMFDPSFQTHKQMLKLIHQTDFIEGLPFEPPHFSKFFGVPVKAIDKTVIKQGGWKECVVCGAHCAVAAKKKDSVELDLTNHIPKKCPFTLLVCASKQPDIAREAKIQTFTASPRTVLKKIKEQFAMFNQIYAIIKPFIMLKYAKFFHAVGHLCPETYTATLIHSNGKPYNTSDLEGAIQRIIKLGQRQGLRNYEHHLEEYATHNHNDLQCMKEVLSTPGFNKMPSSELVREVFNVDLSGNVIVNRHSSDYYLDNKGQPLPPIYVPQQQDIVEVAPFADAAAVIDQIHLARHEAIYNTVEQKKQDDVLSSMSLPSDLDVSLMSTIFQCEKDMATITNNYNAVFQQKDLALRKIPTPSVEHLDQQLAQLQSQYTFKENELIRARMGQQQQQQVEIVEIKELPLPLKVTFTEPIVEESSKYVGRYNDNNSSIVPVAVVHTGRYQGFGESDEDYDNRKDQISLCEDEDDMMMGNEYY